MRTRRLSFGSLVTPAVVIVVLGLVFPMVAIVAGIFHPPIGQPQSLVELWIRFSTGIGIQVLGKTVEIGLITSLATVVLGYPIAYHLYSRPLSRVVRAIIVVAIFAPLFVSVSVRSFAWILVLVPRTGALSFLTGGHEPNLLFTDAAIIIGLAQVMLPTMVLAIYAGLSGINPNVIRAARALGASGPRVVGRILVPLSLPGVFNGITVVYVLSTAAVAIPLILGSSGASMLGAYIYQQYLLQADYGYGGFLTLVLIVATLAFVLLVQLISRRFRYDPL